MTNQATIDKLIEMRLTTMADTFRIQAIDPKMNDIEFEDRFAIIVDAEYTSRKRNRLQKLISGAQLDQPEASVVDINYSSGRKLNRELIERLSTCEYICERRNVFITGATGSGKTYLACALGMEACKQFYKTKYIRLPDLLIELEMAKGTASYGKLLHKYSIPAVLIIDEWLLLKPTQSEQKNIFELLHRRGRNTSTIFCSQFRPEEWYVQLGGSDSPLADAILDRLVHNSYRINIESTNPDQDISMREVYGLAKELRE